MTTISWTAPSVEEQELWNAQQRDDKNAYLAALARTDVFVARPLDRKVKAGFRRDQDYLTARHGLRPMFHVTTRGVMPDQPPEGSYWDRQMFPQWVQHLAVGTHRSSHLLINAGTPLERILTVAEAAAWMTRNKDRVLYLGDLEGTVRTLTNEPTEGELALGLACNAHLSVTNGWPWNTLERPYLNYRESRDGLSRMWLIDDSVSWQNKIDKMLDRDKFPWPADDVFGIRAQTGAGAKPSGDLAVDIAELREAVNAWCDAVGSGAADRETRSRIVEWIVRTEAWLRRDGVLADGEIVPTQAVFHWARCVNTARQGYSCRYCDRATAEQIIVHAGRLTARTYASWREVSAAYIVGRVVQMLIIKQGGTAEQLYTQSLTRHRVLMRDPASPWLRLTLR